MDPIEGPWQRWARCASLPADIFFDSDKEARAKAACALCRVQEECLAYALETRQPDGVWGGLNEQERLSRARAAVPISQDLPLEMVTYTTRARSTGATCSAGRVAGGGWGAVCTTHDSAAVAASRTAAEQAVSRPQEWCTPCADIAAGLAPKISRI